MEDCLCESLHMQDFLVAEDASETANVLVEDNGEAKRVPVSQFGGGVDLSGYAQKSELPTKVSQLDNDKGYLTEHQSLAEYAKKTDIPTVPTKVSDLPNDAGYLTEHQSLSGYATEQFVKDGYQPKGNYALKSEIPDVSGKLDSSALPAAINTALAQAKASGDFDGKDGSNGEDGVSPTVAVSKSGKVTTVSITDKNGTKTATINDGADGGNGSNGKDGTSVTVKSVSESTEDGGSNVVTFSDGKTVTIKNGSKGSAGTNGTNGTNGVGVSSVKQTTTSTADGGSNVVTVTLSNGTTSTFTVKNGSKGSTGAAGKDGYTPQKNVDYWTEADQEAIVQQVITALGTPVFGTVSADKKITLSTEHLADGIYYLGYEDKNGNWVEIGEINVGGPTVFDVPITWIIGTKLNKTNGTVESTTATEYNASDYIQLVAGASYVLATENDCYNSMNVIYYNDNNTFVGYQADLWVSNQVEKPDGKPRSAALVIPSGATKIRLRQYEAAIERGWTHDFITLTGTM